MREIKFRIKCTTHNKWEYYDLGDLVCGFALTDNGEGWFDGNWCQYTGLKDINGNEIYEGDILDTTEFKYDGSDEPFKGLVKFYDSEWELWLGDDRPAKSLSDGAHHLGYIHAQDDELEIIGNIYETPELLK